jgi:peptidoglycan lytic transglycosylase
MGWGCIMSSGSCPATSLFEIETAPNRGAAFLPSLRKPAQLFALALTIAALAACAQAPVTSSRSELSAGGRHASLSTTRNRHVSTFAANTGTSRDTAVPGDAKLGLASFYTGSSRTASGERLNPAELTAAHPSLPFGTRVRVTSVDTGRSVVVWVNDRGPFVKGRALDVSYSAAKQLDMTERGVAKVKMEVLQ